MNDMIFERVALPRSNASVWSRDGENFGTFAPDHFLAVSLAEEVFALRAEVASVLQSLDELAELWGDEGKFRRCRDRLREALKAGEAT